MHFLNIFFHLIVAAHGLPVDFAAGDVGIEYSYMTEFRGPGFIQPADVIEIVFQEMYAGIIAMADEIVAIDQEKQQK